MSKNVDFVKRQWRWTRRFAIFYPFWIALILGLNVWQDATKGEPFDWKQLWLALGMIVFGGLVYLFCSLIFRVVLAKATHDERRQ